MFITLTRRDSGEPLLANTLHVATVSPSKFGGSNVTLSNGETEAVTQHVLEIRELMIKSIEKGPQ